MLGHHVHVHDLDLVLGLGHDWHLEPSRTPRSVPE
jgi:hypothetical protein